MIADEAGRIVLLGWDGGPHVAYDRLVTGEVSAMRENPTGTNFTLASFAYDDLGRRTSLTRGNGAVTGYGYDGASRLTSLSQDLNGSTNDVTTTFSHNPAGEIVSMTRSNDAYAFTGYSNGNVANSVNGLNQVTSTGGSSVTHDNRGNITAIGAASYAYTTGDRLRSSGAATFTYNPEGSILSETSGGSTTRFDTLLGNIITERDGAGNRLRRFVPGPGTDEHIVWYEGSDLSTRRWYHQDERGSVTAVSDASGNLVGSLNRYDEYGAPQGGSITGRFGYTGQPLMAGGLYHYRNRAYNPDMGRFMQTDPIGFGGGMNFYAYVGNNPVNFTDPLGLDEICYPRFARPGWTEGDGSDVGVTANLYETVCSDAGGGEDGEGQDVLVNGRRRVDPCRPQPGDRFDDPRENAEAAARYTYNLWRDANRGLEPTEPRDNRERSVALLPVDGRLTFGRLTIGVPNATNVGIDFNGSVGGSHVHTLTVGGLSSIEIPELNRIRAIFRQRNIPFYLGLVDMRGNIQTWGPDQPLDRPGTPSTLRCPR